jgi:uncharacterized protein
MNIRKRLIRLIVIALIVYSFIYMNNNILWITRVTIDSPKIGENFNGFKIVHISDLHSKSFGRNQQRIINKIRKLKPNIVVITGDIVDSKRYSEEAIIKLTNEISEDVPIYYSTGNHEAWSGKFELSLQKKLINTGVNILRDESAIIERKGEKINILGIDDPSFDNNNYDMSYSSNSAVENAIEKALEQVDINNFSILLSHRPETFEVYARSGIDLVFTGHAHGGQIRLPFVGGLIAPNQGLLPRYDAGKYNQGYYNMIVSRGLGNSIIPVRLFNLPEIVLVTLGK